MIRLKLRVSAFTTAAKSPIKMSKKLSILICSLAGREPFLDRLSACIQPQLTSDVEVLINSDDRQATIGAKRNELLLRATGDYVAFVDDDDLVAPDYVARILEGLKQTPDCIGLEGTITFNGRKPRRFIHSIKYDQWFEKRNVYYRNPNHLNPIKREHALSVMFPEINHQEDFEFSRGLLPYLKSEVYLTGPIYFYEYRTNKTC